MRKLRLISLLLAFILTIGSVCVFAETASEKSVITITAPSTMPKKGDIFEVVVSIKNNPGFCSMELYLEYNSSEFECTDVSGGNLLSGMLYAGNANASVGGTKIAVAGLNAATGDGTLEVLTFKATQDVKSYDFMVCEYLLADADYNNIDVTFVGATLKSTSDESTKTSGESTITTEQKTEEGNSEQETSSEVVTKPIIQDDGEEESSTEESSTTTEKTDATKEDQTVTEDISKKHIFSDSEGTWCEGYASKSAEYGLLKGYGGGVFGVNDNMTRGQFVTVLYRMSGSPEVTGTTPFTDLTNIDDEFERAILWAYQKKYISGKDSTHFDPHGAITRQEAVKILFYYSGGTSGMESMYQKIYEDHYSDFDQVATWAKKAMYWSIYNKVVSGTSSTTLSPTQPMTRGAAAKVLVVYYETLKGVQ